MHDPRAREDPILRDEDGAELGDAMDFLTPREISTARYTQHHDWMEEMIHSPYSIQQITPDPLGLAMAGELGAIVSLLWDDPNKYNKPDANKIKAFDDEMAAYERKAEQQLLEMVEQHQQKLQTFSQGFQFNALERRLAAAGSEGSDETVADVLKEAETLIGAPIKAKEDAACIQKGALVVPATAGEETVSKPVDDFSSFTNLDTAGEALDLYEANMDFLV